MAQVCLRYFTGTGNSRRVMEICRQVLENRGYSTDMALITENGTVAPDAEIYGFCFPVYAFDLPRIAKTFLASLPNLSSPRRTFLLVTAGDKNDIGWALIEGRKILEAKGFQLDYSELIRMPLNWVTMLPVPSREETRVILEEGERHAKAAIDEFLNGQGYHKPLSLDKLGLVLSGILRHGFHRVGIRRLWRKFKTTPACISCGLCARICPMNSIQMVEGRPQWSKTCEQCMRCINFCPAKAIRQLEWIGKGSRNNRYHEPHFHPERRPETEVHS